MKVKIPQKHKLPCIYKATSKTTGKSYIGQSIQGLYERRKGHISDANKTSYDLLSKFHKALIDLGVDDFKWSVEYVIRNTKLSIIEIVNRLNYKEEEYIQKYNSVKEGYNTTKGGNSRLHQDNRTLEELEQQLEIYNNRRNKLIAETKKPGKDYLEARRIRNSKPDKKARMKKLRDKRHNTPEFRAKRKAYRESPEAIAKEELD